MAIESTRDLCLSVADAIREKKGTSELINPQDFAKEIASIEGGGSGEGGELEGEYFLAKPNGRYWKFKFATWERPNVPEVRWNNLTEEQKEACLIFSSVLPCCSVSAIGYRAGLPTSGEDSYYVTPVDVAAATTMLRCYAETGFDTPYPVAFFQEGSAKKTDSIYSFTGIPDAMRLFFEGELDGMSDAEILNLASEMFMIEQITKEEYDACRYWDGN